VPADAQLIKDGLKKVVSTDAQLVKDGEKLEKYLVALTDVQLINYGPKASVLTDVKPVQNGLLKDALTFANQAWYGMQSLEFANQDAHQINTGVLSAKNAKTVARAIKYGTIRLKNAI